MEASEERAAILIVDDERGPRESLRMILSPNHTVLQAECGAEALEILRTREVDLVTLDLHMPGMRGEELMRVIRSEFPNVEVIVITGCGSVESATEGIRCGVSDYLQKPFDVVQVTAAVLRALLRKRSRSRLTTFLDEVGVAVGDERDADVLGKRVQRNQRLKQRLGALFDQREARAYGAARGQALSPERTIEFVEVLAETIETTDPFMRGHARRVAYYSSLLAHRLHLSAEDHEHIRIAAFLHDLGKVGVPRELLLRADVLQPEELVVVQTHPEIGARLIRPLAIPAAVTAAIRHHHEWWDGSGYPHGLAHEDIPLSARIIGVADAFDAMSSNRPYRSALPRSEVLARLCRYAGHQFDPDLVKEFLAILEMGVADVDPEFIAEVVFDAGRDLSNADTQVEGLA
ncbi:MAG: response regulator [Myxococcales bacterium]|nr:response regulator [Myxococcales bacterium]